MAAGSIVIDLLMRTGAFETDTKRAEKRLRELNKTAKVVGAAIGTAFVAAGTAIAGLTLHAINFADQINDMAQKVGIGTETLSAWGYAAQQSGSDIESLSAALPKLAKNIAAAADEGSEMGKLFKTLGVDVKDAAGNLRSVEDILPEIADKFGALEDGTTKTATAMQLFGKTGADLIQFLNNGSSGIESLTNKARELGVVVGDDTVRAAADFKDKLDDLKAIALGFGLDLAQRLLPALNDTVDKLAKLARDGDLAANAVSVISAAFSAGVGAIEFYNTAVEKASIALQLFAGIQKGVAEASMNLGPQGLFTEGSVSGGLKKIRDAYNEADALHQDLMKRVNAPQAGNGLFADVSASYQFTSAAEQKRLQGLQSRLNGFFAGSPKGASTKKGGKSDAERDADRLLASYERLKASLTEQADLYGVTGEAARLRIDLERGELSKLTKAQKDELLVLADRLDFLDREKEMQEKLDRETEAFNEMNDAILEQIGYLGMTADEQEIALNLARAGVAAESERGKQIIANTQALQEQRAQMEDQISAMDAIRNAGSDFLSDWVSGSKSFKDAALDALDSIYDRITQMISENLMDQLFGKQGDPGGGSAGGWLGNLFGGLFSSGSGATAGGGTDMATNISEWFGGARAGGGDVFGNRAYLVGEQGPEMFVPRTAGAVLPADATAQVMGRGGRATQVNQNFYVQGAPDRRTREQMARDSGRAAARGISRTGR